MEYRFKAYQENYGSSEYEWVVKFIDYPNIIGGGDTVEEAYKEAKENLDVLLEYLKEENEYIKQPSLDEDQEEVSGKLVLRLSKRTHKQLKELSQTEQVSINSLINDFVIEGIDRTIARKAVSKLIEDEKNSYVKQGMLKLNKSNIL